MRSFSVGTAASVGGQIAQRRADPVERPHAPEIISDSSRLPAKASPIQQAHDLFSAFGALLLGRRILRIRTRIGYSASEQSQQMIQYGR
jgi:hypothetical protein